MPGIFKVEQARVQNDHRIKLPRSPAEKWLRAGEGFIAPLQCRRSLLVNEGQRFQAWTVCLASADTAGWLLPRADFPDLYYKITFGSHGSAYRFIIPPEIRAEGWLPPPGALVTLEMIEESEEINIWTPEVRQVQYWRERSR